ncbi:MAG: family 43 glycosylhydrolase [Candidatus Bathyarchaeia archaeon]
MMRTSKIARFGDLFQLLFVRSTRSSLRYSRKCNLFVAIISMIIVGACAMVTWHLHESSRKIMIEPFIDESLAGRDGLPDPFVFEDGQYYYIFGTSALFFRTRTFSKGDLKAFSLDLDFAEESGRVGEFWRFIVYRHVDGTYHGYATLHYGDFKTVIAHFAPQPGQIWTEENPITKWRLDKILIGDVDRGWFAYDCNVLRDENGDLYLIYNAGYPNETLGVDIHIKAWRMLDPSTLDPNFTPRPILSPEGYRSEDRNPGYIQIVESVIIQKIQGKYVLLYSVGDFDDYNYKIGVAFSDSLIPPPGETYRKIIVPDPENVWGNVNKGGEILYLLQTENENWPNYVGEYMNGPGIGNIVKLDNQYFLIFHARRHGKTRLNGMGRYVWKIPLKIKISNEIPMCEWIQPILPGEKTG